VADFEFNLNDVKSLAGKLSAAKLNLSEQERQLLLAIFAAAAARAVVTDLKATTSTLPQAAIMVQAAGAGGPNVNLEELQNQLLNAYIPGNYFQAVGDALSRTVGLPNPYAPSEKPAPDKGEKPAPDKGGQPGT
jgi:hypothetical protein